MGERVAVIGAGPSGLAQPRALQSATAGGASVPEIVCYEKQADWGDFDGPVRFNGRVLQSHDFRVAAEFKDKDILVIGTSYSAEDIGSQCWKCGCKSIAVGHRTAPMGVDGPDNWNEVPLLQNVEGNTCTIKDDSSADFAAMDDSMASCLRND